ncbi:MAG: triose-phosphate isomerase [Candidatus Saccharibacteria bacterium]
MANDKKLIIGNWKMNLDMHQASLYLHKLAGLVKTRRDVEVVLAPSVLSLQSLSLQINLRQFKLAAQNFYWRDQGPYTGEVSASQLRGIVQYAIVGHSERRHIFNETERDMRNKVAAAIRNGIKPVLCVGENAWERSNGETKDVIHDQIASGLANITSHEIKDVIIAYEPVWAIGNGNNATPSDVVEVVRYIRGQINHFYGEKISQSITVLYGGSVTPDSTIAYLSLSGVDGLMIGGDSLNPITFSEIIKKAHNGSALAKKD